MDTNTLILSLVGVVLLAIVVLYAVRRGASVKGQVEGVGKLEVTQGASPEQTATDTPGPGIVARDVEAGGNMTARDHEGDGVHAERVRAGGDVHLESGTNPKGR